MFAIMVIDVFVASSFFEVAYMITRLFAIIDVIIS